MDISGNFYNKIIFKKYKRFLIILLICQVYKIVLTFESEFDGWLLVLKMKKKILFISKMANTKTAKIKQNIRAQKKKKNDEEFRNINKSTKTINILSRDKKINKTLIKKTNQ